MNIKNLAQLIIVMALVTACNTTKTNLTEKKTASLPTQKEDGDLTSWIHNTVDSTMKEDNIPALSVGIIREGEIWFSQGFGVKDRDSEIRVDDQSLYQIGSDTKKMTGIIVRNLVLQGKLNLNQPITTYLSEDLTDESKEKLKNVTVSLLLQHKSGIPYRAPSNKRIDGDPMLTEYTEQELLNDLNTIELDFEPGAKSAYSNLGYAVVGHILEKASKQNYSTLLKRYVADKYNMENTVVYPQAQQLSQIVTPYRKENRDIKSSPWKMGKLTPAGGVYSNITDISKLLIEQMKAYKQFNSSDNPLILTDNKSDTKKEYDFGLSKKVFKGGTQYGHGGDLDGYASFYMFSPEHNTGLVLLTSSGGSWFWQLGDRIFFKLTDRKYTSPKK